MPESVHHPTLDEVLAGAVATIKDVLLPNLTDTWARASAAQLTGLLTYARSLSAEPTPDQRTAEVRGVIDGLLATHAELRERFRGLAAAASGDEASETLELASSMLRYAVRAETTGAEAVRRELRPVLVRQLAREAERAFPMLMTFRGDPV